MEESLAVCGEKREGVIFSDGNMMNLNYSLPYHDNLFAASIGPALRQEAIDVLEQLCSVYDVSKTLIPTMISVVVCK